MFLFIAFQIHWCLMVTTRSQPTPDHGVCPICQDSLDMGDQEEKAHCDDCGGCMHASCARRMMKTDAGACPLCRACPMRAHILDRQLTCRGKPPPPPPDYILFAMPAPGVPEGVILIRMERHMLHDERFIQRLTSQ